MAILTACERPSDFAGVVLIAPMIKMNPESATPFKVGMKDDLQNNHYSVLLFQILVCVLSCLWQKVSVCTVFQHEYVILIKEINCFLSHRQVFLAKVLNHVLPRLPLGSINSKWVSRDKSKVRDRVEVCMDVNVWVCTVQYACEVCLDEKPTCERHFDSFPNCSFCLLAKRVCVCVCTCVRACVKLVLLCCFCND